jgi:pimeloyl-ACP methyl ester carboxylesterase
MRPVKNEAFGHGEELPPEQATVDRLVEIRAPSLVIVGDLDQPWTTATAGLLKRKLPNVRKVVVPGVAHLPNMERPEEFNRIVLDYLERRT